MNGIDVPAILLGGVHIAVGVLFTVQGLKVFNFVDGDSAPKAAVISALGFGGLSLVSVLVPSTESIIGLVFATFVGAMAAGLFYEYISAPVLERFGVKVRAEDLS